jgi:hypothetical protein
LSFFSCSCKTTLEEDDDGIVCRCHLVRSETKGQKDDNTISIIFFVTEEEKNRQNDGTIIFFLYCPICKKKK